MIILSFTNEQPITSPCLAHVVVSGLYCRCLDAGQLFNGARVISEIKPQWVDPIKQNN